MVRCVVFWAHRTRYANGGELMESVRHLRAHLPSGWLLHRDLSMRAAARLSITNRAFNEALEALLEHLARPDGLTVHLASTGHQTGCEELTSLRRSLRDAMLAVYCSRSGRRPRAS